MRAIRNFVFPPLLIASLIAAILFLPPVAAQVLSPTQGAPSRNAEDALINAEGNVPATGRAVEVLQQLTDNLIDRPDVVATGLSLTQAGDLMLKVYVKNTGGPAIPATSGGFPVDVSVVGEIVAHAAAVGDSTGPEELVRFRGGFFCTVGTLGCRVKGDLDHDGTPEVYALSNAHVYAREGSEPATSVDTGLNGDRVLSPGRPDLSPGCGTPQEIEDHIIGNLWSFVPIVLSRRASNTVDAAIARTDSTLVSNGTPAGFYGIPCSTPIEPAAALGKQVQKRGRTTGLTTGVVDAIEATVNVRYDQGTARFIHQVIIVGDNGPFSEGGDSGSLIVALDGAPVAHLFAGSSSVTIGNEIQRTLDALGVEIDGRNCGGCSADSDCDDGNLCTDDTCVDGGCFFTPNDTNSCDDGDLCNGLETCFNGNCQSGPPVDCDDGNVCTIDTCFPSTGVCSNTSFSPCCGDMLCELGEDACSCSADCGAPPPTEVDCTNEFDDDCDGAIDCADEDCSADPICDCTLGQVGDPCTLNAECCSNKCRGKPGAKTCKG